MLRFYAIPPSLYCAKLRILLRHKKLAWEEIAPPGGYGSPEFRRIVPAGNLPALLDEGLLLSDSEAIAEYLNETNPEPPMLPESPGARAQVRARSRYHDTRLEPAVRALFPFIGRKARGALDRSIHVATLNDRLDGLARLFEMAPKEEMLTLGDCGFPITFAWLDLLLPELELNVEIPEGVAGYREAVIGHEAVQAELDHYLPVLRNWFDGACAEV
ncbi:glutathione S-transferase family protein [Nisaea sediminum]|uniref:glutathione S-transferase family protein n=1 Tax=Nisaea sediminum TaxID=2775867 RepID=UPI0018685AF0|nr:glutathione S-transferase family protein [Nisaea sediminum]